MFRKKITSRIVANEKQCIGETFSSEAPPRTCFPSSLSHSLSKSLPAPVAQGLNLIFISTLIKNVPDEIWTNFKITNDLLRGCVICDLFKTSQRDGVNLCSSYTFQVLAQKYCSLTVSLTHKIYIKYKIYFFVSGLSFRITDFTLNFVFSCFKLKWYCFIFQTFFILQSDNACVYLFACLICRVSAFLFFLAIISVLWTVCPCFLQNYTSVDDNC